MDVGDKVNDERAAFEAWSMNAAPAYGYETDDRGRYVEYPVDTAWAAWQAARRTPSASTGEDGLPELPKYKGQIDTYHDNGTVTSEDGYTADQMRQYARAAVAAEPSARGRPAHEVVFSVVYSSRIHTKCAPMTSNPVWPLYAAPPLSSEPQACKCVGCEGKPSAENDPCGVCGKASEPQSEKGESNA